MRTATDGGTHPLAAATETAPVATGRGRQCLGHVGLVLLPPMIERGVSIAGAKRTGAIEAHGTVEAELSKTAKWLSRQYFLSCFQVVLFVFLFETRNSICGTSYVKGRTNDIHTSLHYAVARTTVKILILLPYLGCVYKNIIHHPSRRPSSLFLVQEYIAI